MAPAPFSDQTFQKAFRNNLLRMQETSLHSDIKLRIGDLTIPCHRVVLCAASPYFDAMLSHEFSERNSLEVELKCVYPPAGFSLIKYIYTGEIVISQSEVQGLFEACDLLLFDSLKESCVSFMLRHIRSSNCINFLRLAKLHDLKSLAKKSKKWMLEHFEEVVNGNEFSELTQEELIEYISDDHLEVHSEDAVFVSVLKWIDASFECRRSSFSEIVQYVRHPYCTESYLLNILLEELPLRNLECPGHLTDVLTDHFVQSHKKTSFQTRILQSNRMLLVMGGKDYDGNANNYCWKLTREPSSESWEWRILTEMPMHSWYNFSACVTRSGFVVTGGRIGQYGRAERMCWLFEVMSEKWTQLPPMDHARYYHGSVFHDSTVLAVGGYNGVRNLTSVEKYDMLNFRWSSEAVMKEALRSHFAFSFGENIYVFSGINDSGKWSTKTQEYDVQLKSWVYRAEMPIPCPEGAAAIVRDAIYLVSGDGGACMRYQPSTDSWTLLTKMKFGIPLSAVEWKGSLLVGGYSRTYKEYDPDTESWSVSDLSTEDGLWCACQHNLLSFV